MNDDMRYLSAIGRLAVKHGFRSPDLDETWRDYVKALADHVESDDARIALDIRTGMAWTCAA